MGSAIGNAGVEVGQVELVVVVVSMVVFQLVYAGGVVDKITRLLIGVEGRMKVGRLWYTYRYTYEMQATLLQVEDGRGIKARFGQDQLSVHEHEDEHESGTVSSSSLQLGRPPAVKKSQTDTPRSSKQSKRERRRRGRRR
jgi:hypothetical protein